MIKIERASPPADTKMDQQKNEMLKSIKELIDKRGAISAKSFWKDDKFKLWKEDTVKKFLHESQHRKCCYCERIRDQKGDCDVEHFRPKSKYWWLVYDWNNLLISCKKCNQRKGVKFPLQNNSKKAVNEKTNIKEESPILINPLTENPEDFIIYHIPENDEPLMMKAIGKCKRGDKTINELTGINDLELLQERAKCFRNYNFYYKILSLKKDEKIKSVIYKAIKRHMESSSTFAGLARFYFNKVLNLNDL